MVCFDYLCGPRFTAHSRLGPIIRITPEELHVQDADYFEELYIKSGKLDKYVPFSARFGTDQSLFTTAAHDHHRLRRGAINPFFSKKKIVDFQPVIQGHLDKLCRKIAEYVNTDRVLPLHRGFTAVSKPLGLSQILQKCLTIYLLSSFLSQKILGKAQKPAANNRYVVRFIYLLTKAGQHSTRATL